MTSLPGGQSTIKGINYQQWAAMALFLQYLRFRDFEAIHLEAPKSQDFDLLFEGKKVICQSKDWQNKFTMNELIKILRNIYKNISLADNDEILVVGSNISKELISNINYSEYFNKYNKVELELLPRVRFWQVSKKSLENIVYALFSEAVNFWLPQEDLKEKLKAIIIDKFYEGSSIGKTYTKSEFLAEIQTISKKAVTKTTLFNDEFESLDRQFSKLIQDIKEEERPRWSDYDMSSLSAQPNKMFFILEQIKTQKFNLQRWENLWNAMSIKPYYHSLFSIFENNLDKEENKEYILKFIKNNIQEIKKYYQRDFFGIDVVKITKKILKDDKDSKFIEDVFEIVNKLITGKRDDVFYLKERQDNSWERSEVAKLIKGVYEKADQKLKDKIYKFIIDTFNLIKDEGEFSRHTPRTIFEILKDWLGSDLEERLSILTKDLSNQYDQYYKKFYKKLNFEGWEYEGGMTSSVGHRYTVGDRHFIDFTLGPALTSYYDKSKDKNKAWEFIVKHCISETQDVSKDRPDFLNRAILSNVLKRYKSSDESISDEAFGILKKFISSRKGISHKSDLIYQELGGQTRLSKDKKWSLVKVSIDKYKVPISVFVEEIISELAKGGSQEAKETLKDWLRNPKYYEGFTFKINIVQNIRTILDSDFDCAITLFNNYISSDYFINKQDSFESYDVATLLYDILIKNNKQGLEIIKKLAEQKSLTPNQQIILCFSLFNRKEGDKLDDVELLDFVYGEFIDLFLNSLDNNINKIATKVTLSQAREALVQFAERLARNKKIKEALRIVEIFVNDPDPYLPDKDTKDLGNEYNEHQKITKGEMPITITSVRGWCAWALAKCPILEGRDYIKDIIKLTKQLAEDENYYIQHMACFALSQLARVRLTVLPKDKSILFFDDDKTKALQRAKKVEKITFSLFVKIYNSPPKIQKALAKSILHIFDDIRALNQEQALNFVKKLGKFPDDAIVEAAPLFIFFAEFRKDAFKNWKWKTDKLYNDLEPSKFNDKKFKNILLEVIDGMPSEKRAGFAGQFEHIAGGINYKKNDAKKLFEIVYYYLDYLSNEYSLNLFEIIYRVIKDELDKKKYCDEWYKLFCKCLNKEKEYYDKNIRDKKDTAPYWHPSFYHGDILTLIYQELGKYKFLKAFDKSISFSEGVNLRDPDKIFFFLGKFPKSNKKVKSIINKLVKINPSRYYQLRKKWLDKKRTS
ncbi:MAG: hypothetical protein HQ530_00930 [Parcubacteria group bacterium]|nr:hypothetical protein [Parcubacteria group bacterium]